MTATFIQTLKVYINGNSPERAVLFYRIAMFLKSRNHSRLSRYFLQSLEKTYGVYIHPSAELGADIKLPHPVGIVVGKGVRVGRNVTIFQQVTLGAARLGDGRADRYPVVGDNTVIFAGAKIIGEVLIGNDCIIGANAVVTGDVPAHHTAVGIPARFHPNRAPVPVS